MKKIITVLDTNLLLGYILPNDAFHKKAVGIASANQVYTTYSAKKECLVKIREKIAEAYLTILKRYQDCRDYDLGDECFDPEHWGKSPEYTPIVDYLLRNHWEASHRMDLNRMIKYCNGITNKVIISVMNSLSFIVVLQHDPDTDKRKRLLKLAYESDVEGVFYSLKDTTDRQILEEFLVDIADGISDGRKLLTGDRAFYDTAVKLQDKLDLDVFGEVSIELVKP